MAWADLNNFSTVTQYYVIEYNVIRFMVYDWENIELLTLNQMEIREKFWHAEVGYKTWSTKTTRMVDRFTQWDERKQERQSEKQTDNKNS